MLEFFIKSVKALDIPLFNSKETLQRVKREGRRINAADRMVAIRRWAEGEYLDKEYIGRINFENVLVADSHNNLSWYSVECFSPSQVGMPLFKRKKETFQC